MLGDINRSLEPKEYELTLCKPDGEEIQVLYEAKNIKYDAKFPTTDELEFTIPYYTNEDGRKVKNPNWDLISGDYLIKVNDEKYFIITEPEEAASDFCDKALHCYSREYELNKKIVRGYERVSRKLYTTLPEKDDDGELRGVINYISTLTSWSFDTDYLMSNPTLSNKYRAFNVSEKTLLDFLTTDVQEAYQCVFLFDTINKKIGVKEIDDIGENKGLYISEANYMKSINKKIKHDDVVTRLYCYGKDGLTLSGVNPAGTPYIEDFSFFKTDKFMSQSLITALDEYDELIKHHKTAKTFETLLEQLGTLQTNLMAKSNEISELEASLDRKQDEIDSAIKLNQDLTTLNSEKATIENSISSKRTEMSGVNSQITSKRNEIKNFRSSISKENNFTKDQLVELDYFVREKSWNGNKYETEEDLYEEAVSQMQKLSQPPVQFNIDVVDFLKVVDAQHDWDKLVLGDMVNIEFERFGVDIEVRLISYRHDDGYLTLNFSNKDSLDDPYTYLKDLQKNAITTSTTIDMSKYKWDLSEENESAIKNLIDSDLDAAKNKVLAGKNQDVIIDSRGIWLTEKGSDGKPKPEQIRMINNVIAISDDDFKTAKTAITPKGVVAQTLMGRTIIGQQGLFDGIDIFDGGSTPVVEIGRYAEGATIKRGIRLKGGNFEMMGGTNGVSINPKDGIVVSTAKNGVPVTGDTRSIINATSGFKIQAYNGVVWVDRLFSNINGDLTVRNIHAENINVKDGNITWPNVNSDPKTLEALIRIGGAEAKITETEISLSVAENKIIDMDNWIEKEAKIAITADSIISKVRNHTLYKGDLTTMESKIEQTANSITATVNTNKVQTDASINSLITWKNSAELKITDSAIVSTVTNSTTYKDTISGINTKIANAESKIEQTANSIVSTVRSSTLYWNDLASKYDKTTAESEIRQLSNAINLKVTFNDVVSKLNIDTTGVQISARNIELDGITRVNQNLILGSGSYNGRITFRTGASISATTWGTGVGLHLSGSEVFIGGHIMPYAGTGSFRGSWDFTGANVTGISATATFG